MWNHVASLTASEVAAWVQAVGAVILLIVTIVCALITYRIQRANEGVV